MRRRVVVTGMGAITPIGNSVEEFWNAVREEKTGFGEITHFDASGYKCHLAAEVKNFDGKNYMDPKAAKRMELFCQYAVAATKEAIADAGLEMEKEEPYLVGTAIGSGVGSLQAIEREYKKLLEKGPGRVNPLLVPMMISNMAAGNVAIDLGCKGKCTDVVTACATGSNSIGDALRAIQYGDADVMFAGGTESCICPTGIAGFTALTALTKTEDTTRASIPFDKGFEMTIDGVKVKCEKVNKAFLGFHLEAGKHKIRILYHAPGVTAGKILTGLGVLIVIAGAVRKKKCAE